MPYKSSQNPEVAKLAAEIDRHIQQSGIKMLHRRLQAHPGFEQISPTTLYRWRHGEGHPERIASALRVIARGAGGDDVLRIALPKAVSLAPAQLLAPNGGAAGRAANLKNLPARHGLTLSVHPTDTGGKAIDLLIAGGVDVALTAHDHFQTRQHPRCRRLCSVARTSVVGLAPDGPLHKIGFLSGAAVPSRLQELERTHGISAPRCVELQDEPAVVRALRDRSIDGFIGLEPYVSSVERTMRQSSLEVDRKRVSALKRRGGFGSMMIDLAVDPDSSARAVWAYLQCLDDITAHVEANKSRPAFVRAIAAVYSISATDVGSALATTTYRIDDLEVATMFQIVRELLATRP